MPPTILKYSSPVSNKLMHLTTKEAPLIYTNIFFLFPLLISLKNHQTSMFVMILIFLTLSALHHTFKKTGSEWWWQTKGRYPIQTFLLVSEISSALILAFFSFNLLLYKSFSLLLSATIIFIPSFIMFLSSDYKKYVLYHSIWHFSGAIILTLALI